MINIKKGSLHYGQTEVLKELDLTVSNGEFVVICGPSGCGKSSLIRVLNSLVPELYEGQLSGEFQVLDHELPTENFSDYVKQIGVVFQNPKTQFFMNDVYSELGFEMENYGVNREEMERTIQEVVRQFDLRGYLEKSMHELSGGEKQRIAFASSSTMPHELFLLDEPSSNLDETHIELIQRYLEHLKGEGHTIVVAEHRLYYLLPLADRFIFMKNGRIIHDFTKEQVEGISAEEVKNRGLRSLKKPTLDVGNQANLFVDDTQGLTCRNLSYHYKNSEGVMVEKAHFSPQTITGIIGENGAGKTTFSQLMTGLLKPQAGEITFNGKKQSPKELIKKSFMVMQDVNLQLFFESVEKEITAKAKRLDIYEEVLDLLDLRELLERHPQTLSGGQKQRVAIASAVLSGKEILILDEPTSGLDLKHMIEVSHMMLKLKEFQVILLIVSHDKEFLSLCCDHILEIKKGQLVR